MSSGLLKRTDLEKVAGRPSWAEGPVWLPECQSVRYRDVSPYSPAGQLGERIPVPEVVANLCFGGVDRTVLYVTATTSLFRIETTTTDAVQAARSARAHR